MQKMQGGGYFVAGCLFILLGAILRWDLIDWIIDAAGFLLILLGIVLGIVGLVRLISGGARRTDYDNF